MGRSTYSHPNALANSSTSPGIPTTFRDLGLHPPIVSALQSAFPNVQYPTEVQAKFIPAILGGKDVLLKDATGSGKLVLRTIWLLLRGITIDLLDPKTGEQRHITSLVLVPHRDLAYQLYNWIERMTSSADPLPLMPTIAQVLVRDGHTHLTTGLQTLRDTPPHILIGTPQAIHDIFQEDAQALQLTGLSTVVVDEVDYLIETIPKKDPNKSFRKAFEKASRKLLAHPGVTRELLDIIYVKRKEINERRRDEPGLTQHRRTSTSRVGDGTAPQLIMSSATLRSHLRNYLFEESGWLNRDQVVKVKGMKRAVEPENVHDDSLVSDNGVVNIEGAVPAEIRKAEDGKADPEMLFGPSAALEPPEIDARMVGKYADKPSPFNPNAFEAIATTFALEVPSMALLVLPSTAPSQRAVYELREMGVNAHGLDVLGRNKGQGDLGVRDNPILLVSTMATTRGMDLRELTHVFMLGIPESGKMNGRTVDGYVHIAGRVGRFGGGGKVITVIEQGEELKMKRILETIETRPVELELFD
ncbi:P-loop containing nucleoside triphosphate hydrolase protein [Collybia nuda]|uniref:RNA helicase n=1 Tax=Collybia nuda TaxID=64659 RepID=A0A9P6CIQ9_9AGAR|nr:P-loop containing nucleoside triphosphate hydrolase protein [Collybia nuda]